MNLEGKKKIGALLMSLDRNVAAQVLKNFNEDEILVVGEAMREMSGKDIPREDLQRIFEDYKQTLKERAGFFRPRGEDVEELFASTLDPEKRGQLLKQLKRSAIMVSPFKKLARFPKEILLKVLKDEHPQTIALVLSHIDSSRAAQVITELEEEQRLNILTRVARLKSPPNDVIMGMASKLVQRANQALIEESPEDAKERLRTVADVLNRLDKETEKSVLGRISEGDKNMAEEIRELMFTFDDLLLVDKRAMQKILSGINIQVLSLALKGAKKRVESFITSNVSSRVKRLIDDEKELMGPKPVEEVLAAQKEVVSTVRALIESGEISINRTGSEEELLV